MSEIATHPLLDRAATLRLSMARQSPRPRRIRAAARLDTSESFVAYVNRFKRSESALFACARPEAPSIQAIIDFDGMGPAAMPAGSQHTARYDFPVSAAFQAWKEAGRSLMTQEEFTHFIEDHGCDIASPPADWGRLAPAQLGLMPARLGIRDDPAGAVEQLQRLQFGQPRDLVRLTDGIEVTLHRKALQHVATDTGARTELLQEDYRLADRNGHALAVPKLFLARLPIFEAEQAQLLPVRLCHRLKAGAVHWGISMVDPGRLVRQAAVAAAEAVAARTGLPLFFGTPRS